MKTTVDIPEALMIRAKKRAVELRRPFRELVIEGLRARLDADAQPRPLPPAKRVVRWVCHDGGLPVGLDLSDRSCMHEWLSRNR